MRLEIPERLAAHITAYAEIYGISSQDAGKRLLDDLDAAFQRGVPAFLGPTWHPSTPPDQKSEKGPSLIGAPTLTAEQIALLERSEKLPSGFAGVYAGNGGWRGQARGGRMLKTRPTPELAAWDRYSYAKENGLPYGAVAENLAWLRERMPDASEEELRREAESLEMLRSGDPPPGSKS